MQSGEKAFMLVAALALASIALPVSAQDPLKELHEMQCQMDFKGPAHCEAVGRVSEYYDIKKAAKAAHADWQSEQIWRYSVCVVALTYTINSSAEQDERADLINEGKPLCEAYAQAKRP